MELTAAILHYCKYQERCHSEVRNKLYELGCNKAEVEQHITTLIENGTLNEERFAIAYAGGKFRMKQWGKEKIRQQLKLRKISDYCIKKAIANIDGEAYERTLQKIAGKKADELKRERSPLARKAKLYRYLVQKGYERDIVSELVNNIFKRPD